MNSTGKSVNQEILSLGNTEHVNTAMLVIIIIKLAGLWILKLKKRLQNNEARVQALEYKLSKVRVMGQL